MSALHVHGAVVELRGRVRRKSRSLHVLLGNGLRCLTVLLSSMPGLKVYSRYCRRCQLSVLLGDRS
jgi:hypothetical protein